jgi:dissimilatory sulfite reductase (desulfoviridin) alpha/beta subunit
MQWTPEAENAVKKVPFFVRKRVRARVEKEARQEGKALISLAEVTATQQRYLTGMAAEVKGYQLDTCFGSSGCPHQIQSGDALLADIEALVQKADLLAFLKVSGVQELKFHHELRITLADCPNACSQPQIKDIGIIGASRPEITAEPCSRCLACETICKEKAVTVEQADPGPMIRWSQCVYCGQCLAACPTGTLTQGPMGYRVYLGGKLGRHPRLAVALPGIYAPAAVLEIVQACLDLYKSKSRNGRRFAEILTSDDIDGLATDFAGRRIDG